MAPLNSIQYEQIEVFRIQVNVFILRINHEAEWSVLSPPNFCNFNVKKYMTIAKNYCLITSSTHNNCEDGNLACYLRLCGVSISCFFCSGYYQFNLNLILYFLNVCQSAPSAIVTFILSKSVCFTLSSNTNAQPQLGINARNIKAIHLILTSI